MDKRQNEAGFTLVEMLSATAIAIPMVILIMSLVPRMASVSQTTKSTTIASHLSSVEVEDIYRSVRANSAGMSTDYSDSGTAYTYPHDGYVRTITDSLDPNIKTITVSVWRDLDSDLTYDSQEPGFTTLTHIAKY